MMLSIIIIAKNEEGMIKTCLESVKWADEIIVIDNGSTDKTADIAIESGARVVKLESDGFSKTRNEPKVSSFAALRNRGMEEAKGEWVLYVDADERVSAELKAEIFQLIKSEKSAFAVSRKNIIFGEKVSYGPYKNDWVIRLFKKDKFETWVGKVHEYGKFKGGLGYTRNSLLHLTHRNLDHFILKALEWSKIDASLRLESGHPKMTKWRFIRILITQTYEELLKRKGLFGGTVGIIDSVLQVFSFHMTYVRLWELQQPKPVSEVYKDIDKKLVESGFKI